MAANNHKAFSRDYRGPQVSMHNLVPDVAPVSSKELNAANDAVSRSQRRSVNSVENMERFSKLHKPVCAHEGCKKNGIYMKAMKGGRWTAKVLYCSLHRDEAMT